MRRLKIATFLLITLAASLLTACGTAIQDNATAGPSPTPRTATSADIELLKQILRTNAEELKSYHQVLEETGDLFENPGTKPPVTRLEADVERPGRTHTWGVDRGEPTESYVLDGVVYTKDRDGNWVDQGTSSEVEATQGFIFGARPETIEQADRVLVFDSAERINGVITQRFMWEKLETSGWFSGATFTNHVWIDPQTRFAQKSERCLWIVVSSSGTPGVGPDVRRESCTTTIYTKHNEKISIGAVPFTDLRTAPETNTAVAVTEPPCGTWDIRSTPAEKAAPGSSGSSFNSVAALAPDDVWLAGSKIEHWNGKEWASYPLPVTGNAEISDLAAISHNDVWAVGTLYEGDGRGLALHWDGEAWKEAAVEGFILLPKGVDGTSANDVWVVGYNNYVNRHEGIQTMHWDGKIWRDVPVPNKGEQSGPPFDTSELRDVVAISSNDVWAVGKTVDQLYLVLHWNGSAWAEVTMPQPTTQGYGLDAVSAVSANDVWAVPGFWHWDGKAWAQAPFEKKEAEVGSPTAISAISADNAWAVGWSGVWHWDGKMWRTILNPVAELVDDHAKGGIVNAWLAAVAARQEGVWITGPAKSDRLMVAHFTPGACSKP